MNLKSGVQDLLFCPTVNCRVISFVPVTGVLLPACPGCQIPGVRVRGPVGATDHRVRRSLLALVRDDEVVEPESEDA